MVIEMAALQSWYRLNLHITFIITSGIAKVPFAVFWDLSKAFDIIDHNIVLHKLDHYGIRGVEKHYFESYITNRQQGIVLGALLFIIIYIIECVT